MSNESGNSGAARVDRLGTGSISKLLLEFALPAIIGVVINGLYNIIDAIFLGHGVGALGLAATTVAFPTMVILMAFSMLVGMGGNALAAIKLGEGKLQETEKILGNSLVLLVFAGIVVGAIGIFAVDPLLRVSGATDEVMDYSRTFLRIICAGFIFQGIGYGINNFIRTAGEPNTALGTMIIGAVVCIALNYLFVLRLHFGVAGSAMATICGQAVSAVVVIRFFLSKKASFKLRACNLKLDGRLARKILLLGLAPFALQLSAALVNIVLNNVVVIYGAMNIIGSEGGLAAVGVIGKVAMLAVFPVIGVSMGAQPLLGYNYGARNIRRVKKTFGVAVLWATVIITLLTLLIQIFPVVVSGFFGIGQDLMDFTATALRIYTITLPIVGFQIIGSNYFQATGQPFKSMFLSLTRQLIFLIPLLYFLPQVLPSFFTAIDGLLAVFCAAPCSDLLATVTTLIFVIVENRRLNRMLDEADNRGEGGGSGSGLQEATPQQEAVSTNA